jgi:hypothetical protein
MLVVVGLAKLSLNAAAAGNSSTAAWTAKVPALVMSQVPLFVTATVPVTVVDVSETTIGVIDAIPWTVITSVEAVPAVPSAGCLAAVDAPVGSETVPVMLPNVVTAETVETVVTVPESITA